MSAALSPGQALYPVSAAVRVDRALRLLRALPARELLVALGPGALILILTVSLYFVERVEGVRSLRPLFAVLFTGAFITRAVVLSRWAGRRVETLLAAEGIRAMHGSTQAIVRAAFWMGVDLWLWLWLLVVAIQIEPWLVVLVLPSFCLRAALLPSFLASADGSQADSGFALLRTAIEESDGQRMAGVFAELLLLLGALGLTFNLAALLVGIVSLGQDMFGLDLAFVRAFLSPRNYFALLVIGGLALTCVEPVRAALSALLYVETRLSRDGLALRAIVERCVTQRAGPTSRVAWTLLVGLSFSVGHAAQAQDSSSDLTVKVCDEICQRARAGDADVTRRVEQILNHRVFAEFPDERWDAHNRGLAGLLERFARFLSELSREEQVRSERPSSLTLPGGAFFVVVALLLMLITIWLLLARKNAPVQPSNAGTEPKEDAWLRSVDEHLQDARRQRHVDLTAALRSLYLATLVGLARRGRLTLSPERTNGQYLQDLKNGEERSRFMALTRSFDRVHYGRKPPSQADYEHCLTLAEQLVGQANRR